MCCVLYFSFIPGILGILLHHPVCVLVSLHKHYVCVRVCACVRTYVCVCVCARTRVCVCMCVCTRAYVCVCMHTCVCVSDYLHVCVCTYVCKCMCIREAVFRISSTAIYLLVPALIST